MKTRCWLALLVTLLVFLPTGCTEGPNDEEFVAASHALDQATLDLVAGRTGEHLCYAALVEPSVALTAAHCVDNWPPGRLLVRGAQGDEAALARITQNTHYDQARDLTFDLAVLYFAHDLTDKPMAVSLADPARLDGTAGLVSTQKGITKVSIQTFSDCAAEYSKTRIVISSETDMCATGDGGQVCRGDSGAPLVGFEALASGSSSHRPVLVGLVSRGIDCSGNTSGIYSAVGRPRMADFLRYALHLA